MGGLRVALLKLVAVLAVLEGLACAGGALVAQGGRFKAQFDVFAHFAPVWLVGGLGVILYGLVFARGRLRLATLVPGLTALVAAGSLIAPELTRPMSPRVDPGLPGQIKVIQFNTEAENMDPEAAARWIVGQDPDIVVIEEATALISSQLLALAPYHVTCPNCDVMILSKAAPLSSGVPWRELPPPVPPLARATFAAPGGPFTVVGVHMFWPLPGDFQQRQAVAVADLLNRFPRERLLLVGDFNSTPWSFARRRQDALFGLERRTRALFSWPAGQFPWFPFLPIDHIYAGADIAKVSVRRGPKLTSDHYPVVAVLKLGR